MQVFEGTHRVALKLCFRLQPKGESLFTLTELVSLALPVDSGAGVAIVFALDEHKDVYRTASKDRIAQHRDALAEQAGYGNSLFARWRSRDALRTRCRSGASSPFRHTYAGVARLFRGRDLRYLVNSTQAADFGSSAWRVCVGLKVTSFQCTFFIEKLWS